MKEGIRESDAGTQEAKKIEGGIQEIGGAIQEIKDAIQEIKNAIPEKRVGTQRNIGIEETHIAEKTQKKVGRGEMTIMTEWFTSATTVDTQRTTILGTVEMTRIVTENKTILSTNMSRMKSPTI